MSTKNGWVLFILLLIAIVLGSFLAEVGSHIPFLKWLAFGQTFSMGTKQNPFTLDLGIFVFSFYLAIKISIASIVGIIIAFLIYKKI